MKHAFLDKRNRLKAFNMAKDRLKGRTSQQDEDKTVTCPVCEKSILLTDLRLAHYICPFCQTPLKMPAHAWIEMLLDQDGFKEHNGKMRSTNPLAFEGYDEKLLKEQERSGINDSVVIGSGKIEGRRIAIGCMDNRFMMGSMGVVCGEKLTSLVEWATKKKTPLVIVATSGGARMQEGIFSLMQMTKTTQAIGRFHEAGLFYLVVLTNPVTGGVMASFASLGDVTLAEPDALIGFAGPRVIQSTVGGTLPKGFQRAEYQQAHGFIDAIVPRLELRKEISFYLALHQAR